MFLFNLKTSNLCFILSVITFFVISFIIFNYVYITSQMIVDEEFHLPLGKAYCNFDFFVWDPKVTTLPGLYLTSSLLMGPLSLCTTYWLRLVSLAFSFLNILLFYILFAKYEQNEWGNILSSITLALLPPLYFFSHFYYTDVVSLSMILLMFVANEKNNNYFAAFFGFCAVLCRQTNIIWVAMVGGRYVLIELYHFVMNKNVKSIEKGVPIEQFWNFLLQVVRQPMNMLFKTTIQFWLDIVSYAAIMIGFLIFLKINGGIVVGDKTSHEATIHIPQLFYFSLFSLVFAWPHFVGEVLNFLTFTRRHKLFILLCIVLGCLIVWVNTQVHPYMLADNRHYVFYIWNRFYAKYAFFRYIVVPVYIFAWYVIIKLLHNNSDASFLILYLFCVTLVLITQKLIEVRYFFVPYILFRLRIKSNANTVFNIVLEFVTYLLVNSITFNLFFTKTIRWSGYADPQRLIW